MPKQYNYQVHSNIMKALKRSNDIIPGSKFTTLDGNILCMVKSFSDSGYDFFMSDKELAEVNITSEKTIQRSLKRLCEAGLLKTKDEYYGFKRSRHITYQPEAVQRLLDQEL